MNRKPPDIEGCHAGVWKVNAPHTKPDHAASVSQWVIKSKGPIFHILWDRWAVNLIALRDIPGVPPAKKKFAEATHELIVASIDPSSPDIDVDNPKGIKWLRPIDHVIQFEVPSDAAAVLVVERCLEAVAHGELSPDQDYRAVWSAVIGALSAHQRGDHGDATDVN